MTQPNDHIEVDADLPDLPEETPFSAYRHDGPARIWFNNVLVAGIVCNEPKSWGREAFKAKKFRMSCVFKLGLKSGKFEHGYMPVWCYSHLAPRVLTTVHKGDQVIIHGANVTRTYRAKATGRAQTVTGIRARQVMRVPDRTENYYQEECTAVPRAELARLREIERQRTLEQHENPEQLMDLVDSIGAVPLTDEQLEETLESLRKLSEGGY